MNDKKILIFSGGILDKQWASEWLKGKNFNKIMAADFGAVNALECAFAIDEFFGDMDSVCEKYIADNKSRIKKINKLNKEKDATDTDYVLEKAMEETPDEIVILGATGERIDHVFTTIMSVEKALKAGIQCCIYDKYNKIYIADSIVTIRKNEQYGDYISIVPLDVSVTLSLEGFKYNLSKTVVCRGSTLLQSNEIEKDIATIKIHRGKVIVFESKDKN